MRRSEKEAFVQDLSQRLRRAKAVILAGYSGLKVSEITELRRQMKKNAGELRVVKNRLAKRAIAGTPFDLLGHEMKGPLAMAISDGDPVILSKVLAKFAKDFAALKLKVGALGTQILSPKDIQHLAELPSKEELYAKVLGALTAPAQGLVRTLQGVPQKLVMVLKAVEGKKHR